MKSRIGLVGWILIVLAAMFALFVVSSVVMFVFSESAPVAVEAQ
jgi:hypothetical protein